MTGTNGLARAKGARRLCAKQNRLALVGRRDDAADRIAAMPLVELWPNCPANGSVNVVVAGYFPKSDEFDVLPLVENLRGEGCQIVLPVVAARDEALVFRLWRKDEALVPGVMGIDVPPPTAPILRPDLLLVPFLEADRHGYRLGYGGGYYDRSLADLRKGGTDLGAGRAVRAIGVGFQGQIVDEVPHGSYDAPLDALLTEAGLFSLPDTNAGSAL